MKAGLSEAAAQRDYLLVLSVLLATAVLQEPIRDTGGTQWLAGIGLSFEHFKTVLWLSDRGFELNPAASCYLMPNTPLSMIKEDLIWLGEHSPNRLRYDAAQSAAQSDDSDLLQPVNSVNAPVWSRNELAFLMHGASGIASLQWLADASNEPLPLGICTGAA